MKTILLFKKSLLTALIAALVLAALPRTNAYAAAQADLPSGERGPATDARLETGWARMHVTYSRLGRVFDGADARIARVEKYIDTLNGQGVDTTELQAALDAFEAALKAAHPLYESAKGILNSHQGFDDAGQVTDHDKAVQTVQDMGEKLKSIKEAMDGTGRALREVVQEYREKYPQATPTPGTH